MAFLAWCIFVFVPLSFFGTVYGDITFTEQPSDTVSHAGETVVLRCRVSGHNAEIDSVMWIVNPNEAETFVIGPSTLPVASHDIDSRYTILIDSDEGHYDLEITDCRDSDSGDFRCLASTFLSREATLHVITLTPPDSGYPKCYGDEIVEGRHIGETVSVTCESKGGDPPAILTWDKGGESVSGMYSVDPFPRHVYQWTLSWEDKGKYLTCTAMSPQLPSPTTCTSGPINLLFSAPDTDSPTTTNHPTTTDSNNITSQPSLQIQPTVNDVYKGEEAMFTCIYIGDVSIQQLVWKVDNVPLQLLPDRFKIENDNRTLRFVAESSDDGAIFHCEVRHDIGLSYSTAILRVFQEQPKQSGTSPLGPTSLLVVGVAAACLLVLLILALGVVIWRCQCKKRTKSKFNERPGNLQRRRRDSHDSDNSSIRFDGIDLTMFNSDHATSLSGSTRMGRTLYIYQNGTSESYT